MVSFLVPPKAQVSLPALLLGMLVSAASGDNQCNIVRNASAASQQAS